MENFEGLFGDNINSMNGDNSDNRSNFHDDLSGLFISVLERGGLSQNDIDIYLLQKGYTNAEIEQLKNEQIIYKVNIKDYEELEKDVLVEAIKRGDLHLAYKMLDMVNKKNGKYSNKIDVTTDNEPIKITFG